MNLQINEQIIKQLKEIEKGVELNFNDLFLLTCLYKQENKLLLVWNENLSNNQIFFTVYQKCLRLGLIKEDYSENMESTYILCEKGELIIKEIIENQ